MDFGEEAGLERLESITPMTRSCRKIGRASGEAHLVVADVARVEAGIADQRGLTGDRDRADDALAHGDLQGRQDSAFTRVLRAVGGALDGHSPASSSRNHRVLEAEAGDRAVGHVPQDIVEVGLGVEQRGGEVIDHVEVVGLGLQRGAAGPQGRVLLLQRCQVVALADGPPSPTVAQGREGARGAASRCGRARAQVGLAGQAEGLSSTFTQPGWRLSKAL